MLAHVRAVIRLLEPDEVEVCRKKSDPKSYVVFSGMKTHFISLFPGDTLFDCKKVRRNSFPLEAKFVEERMRGSIVSREAAKLS